MNAQLPDNWFDITESEAPEDSALKEIAQEMSSHAMLASAEFSAKALEDAPLPETHAEEKFKTHIMMLSLSRALFAYLCIQYVRLGSDVKLIEGLTALLVKNYKEEYSTTADLVNDVWKEASLVSSDDFDPLHYLMNSMKTKDCSYIEDLNSPVELMARIIASHFYPDEEQPKTYSAIKRAGYLAASKFMAKL